MKAQLLSLLTLGFAKGYRTYLYIGTIGILALLHKYAGLAIPDEVWGALFLALAACLRGAIATPPAAALLLASLLSLAALPSLAADTNAAPRLYAVTSASLEAHHGALAAASDYGYTLHVGAEYELLSFEGVMSGPLARGQQHVRRSLGTEIILHPFALPYVEPFVCAGTAYYFGNDGYCTWAADAGAGFRLPVSSGVFLQFDARLMFPFSTTDNRLHARDHFEVIGIGLGAKY